MNVRELKLYCKEQLSLNYAERECGQICDRLIEEYLQYNRVESVLNSSKKVAPELVELFESALNQMKKGKPVDYVLGKTIFFGREFKVDNRVLIPRPETEELCQFILERELDHKIKVLDIGTGSACIPITLKLEGGFKQVDACEFSEEALQNAIENARMLKADVELFQMDILSEVPNEKYDVIVSNPPYVLKEELGGLDPHVVEFEPLIALAPEGEALQFYRRILSIMPDILKQGGRLYFEIHEDKGEEIEVLMRHHGLKNVEVVEDLYGRDRIAYGHYEI